MRKILEVVLPAVVIALLAWQMWQGMRRAVPPWGLAQARFSLAYTRAREGSDYFSRCAPTTADPALQDRRILVQRRFAEMRKAAVEGQLGMLVDLDDKKQQVLSEDAAGIVRNDAICQRLGPAGQMSQTEVLRLIGGAEAAMGLASAKQP